MPAARPLTRGLGFAYPHDGGDLSTAVHRCVGVGKCRADATATGGVMCPSYLATRDEKDSTRARARVLQELANGTLVRGFDDAAVAESLDLCLSCKGCSSDCPAGVDMATYKSEALYQRYRRRLRPAAHYALGWLPRWARLAARAPRVANATAVDRRWPGWPSGGRRRRAARAAPLRHHRPSAPGSRPARRPTRRHARCMVWVDTFTDHFAPEVGQAAVRVLEGAGLPGPAHRPRGVLRAHLDLHRPAGRRPAATAPQPGCARTPARSKRTVSPIVGLEPSCTAVLRDDLLELLPGRPARRPGRRDHPHPGRTAAPHRRLDAARPHRRAGRGPAALPPARGHGLGRPTPRCSRGPAPRSRPSAAAADWPATSASSGATTRCPWPSPRTPCSLRCGRAAEERSVLADGFSCRTQLDQLAGTTGRHLAQLLDEATDEGERSP